MIWGADGTRPGKSRQADGHLLETILDPQRRVGIEEVFGDIRGGALRALEAQGQRGRFCQPVPKLSRALMGIIMTTKMGIAG